MARISLCDVGRPFSVTVTGAVHASCGAAQIRSCLQHSTQCVPYKPMHNAFNRTADRLYKRDCLLQPTRLAISSTSASTSEHSTISAVILLYLHASALQNLIISYPAYFLRSLIIQLHIEFFINSDFFINSRLYIFVPYIASDFYNTLLPTFTIMHRSVSFHRTFGDMTQTCAFFNFNVFNVLPTQEGDFCVWRAGLQPVMSHK